MRPVLITKVPARELKASTWASIDPSRIELPVASIEELFGRDDFTSSAAKTSKAVIDQKPSVMRLLEAKRSQQIGSLLLLLLLLLLLF
jgi:hypothetical protein